LRDILTVIAGILIILLTAALVAPPLVPWEAYRETLERALTEAAGTQAKTEGRIKVRLLPWPRVSVDQLRLGTGRPDSPSLAATVVRAEEIPTLHIVASVGSTLVFGAILTYIAGRLYRREALLG